MVTNDRQENVHHTHTHTHTHTLTFHSPRICFTSLTLKWHKEREHKVQHWKAGCHCTHVCSCFMKVFIDSRRWWGDWRVYWATSFITLKSLRASALSPWEKKKNKIWHHHYIACPHIHTELYNEPISILLYINQLRYQEIHKLKPFANHTVW